MELALLIYVINSLNKIVGLLVLGPFIFFAVTGFWTICTAEANEPQAIPLKWFKRAIVIAAICIPTAVLLPNTKTAWMMTGGYIAQQVVTSETAMKLTKLVGIKLDEMIEDAISQKEKK